MALFKVMVMADLSDENKKETINLPSCNCSALVYQKVVKTLGGN